MGIFKFDGTAAAVTATPQNQLYGTSGKDNLVGGSGADALWGGSGDTLSGGAGDDTYYVKLPTDSVVEAAGGGTDRVVTWMSFDLSKFTFVENLQVNGDKLYARGNNLDNIIEGSAGSQTLYGGLGQDVLTGGAGADVFVVVKGEGNDAITDFATSEDKVSLTSTYKTFADVQAHLTQVGSDVKLDLGGNDGLMFRNTSVGDFKASNFDLTATGASTTTTSTVTATTATVAATTTTAAATTTTTATAATTTTATTTTSTVDHATTSSGSIADTSGLVKTASVVLPFQQLTTAGVATDTTSPVSNLYGVSGQADTLTGTSKAEGFWGGDGDKMIGGAGDDTYYLKSPSDKIVEAANGGNDQIISWMNVDLKDYPNVENVTVNGDGLYAAGNDGSNYVRGGGGAQQIYGGLGNDVLSGGAGKDTFIVIKGQGNDVITDFSATEDRVRLSAGLSTFADVKAHLTQQGSDVVLDMGGGDNLLFKNVSVGAFTAQNFQLQIDVSKLGKMTFDDEFSGKLSLWDAESNPTGTWRPDYGYQGVNGAGSYSLVNNGEKQIYTSQYFRGHNGDFAESPFTSNSDGTLTITAKQSTNSEIFGYGYTSGLITTKESFSQTYGYFEMRAHVPDTAGAWPAFWMLPKDGSWPPELDIMEVLSKDAQVTNTTVHSSVDGHTSETAAVYTPDTADGMHTYGVLWTKTDLIWYVDRVEVFHTSTPTDMNKPMYLLANLAVGGWGGAVDNANMPAGFTIDYIRAYQVPDGWVGA